MLSSECSGLQDATIQGILTTNQRRYTVKNYTDNTSKVVSALFLLVYSSLVVLSGAVTMAQPLLDILYKKDL